MEGAKNKLNFNCKTVFIKTNHNPRENHILKNLNTISVVGYNPTRLLNDPTNSGAIKFINATYPGSVDVQIEAILGFGNIFE